MAQSGEGGRWRVGSRLFFCVALAAGLAVLIYRNLKTGKVEDLARNAVGLPPIDRNKHPIRYWSTQAFLVFFAIYLASAAVQAVSAPS